uniref:Putative secreted protein n=1 Tax=Anopheles darlingi TaxID=43151 RepID=A0A2M4DM73_ANODA
MYVCVCLCIFLYMCLCVRVFDVCSKSTKSTHQDQPSDDDDDQARYHSPRTGQGGISSRVRGAHEERRRILIILLRMFKIYFSRHAGFHHYQARNALRVVQGFNVSV